MRSRIFQDTKKTAKDAKQILMHRPSSLAFLAPWRFNWFGAVIITVGCSIAAVAMTGSAADAPKSTDSGVVPDPEVVGGESTSTVQVANLVYAGTKTSECFADHFLRRAELDSSISTSRRFHSVKLSSDEIYNFPLLIMTGEGDFELPSEECDNLRRFVERGGFLLASAGCSSTEWNRSFRRAMAKIFPDRKLEKLGQDHLVFHTVYDINELKAKHGKPQALEGIHFGTRLGVLYSQDGLNDTANTQGCCCCGGNEITNAEQINVNILIYSLSQ